MIKLFKIIEYGFLIIALFLLEETIRTWGDTSKTFLYVVFIILAVFMYFFNRWYRKRLEQ